MRAGEGQTDAYYFAPQQSLGSEGGLWLALLSPAAVERAERLAADRWIPTSLDLRANGIVDTEPYRKLGRNQLRIGMFPTVEPDDISALCACIDWVVDRS